MMGRVFMLACLALLLAACGGDLQNNDASLSPLRVDSCTYQGAAFTTGNSVAGDTSANCDIIRDGFDVVKAFTTLQQGNTQNGSYVNVSDSNTVTIQQKSPATYSISFSHLYTERYCLDGQKWFRAKMTIRWYSNSGVYKGATEYYSPSQLLDCKAV